LSLPRSARDDNTIKPTPCLSFLVACHWFKPVSSDEYPVPGIWFCDIRYTNYDIRYLFFLFTKKKGLHYILDSMARISQKTLFLLVVLCGLLLGQPQPDCADAKEMSLLAFGSGKTDVRLYTDYFCGPCGASESKIEHPILDLVTKNAITVTFVDTPFYKYSSLYVRYFLYILNEKKELHHALAARAALFEAARAKIYEQGKLEAFLRAKGIGFRPFDVKPVFNMLQGYLREDKINATPSCVIRNGGKKEVHSGGENILKALEALK